MKSNAFSKHDNRHTIENYGVYLGSGLGKRNLSDPSRDLHRSDSKLFMDGVTQLRCPTSTYISGYKLVRFRGSASGRCLSADAASTAQPIPAKCPSASTKERLHRFPRKYCLPRDLEGVRPSVSSTWWFNQDRLQEERSQGQAEPGEKDKQSKKNTTTFSVLAASQQPFLQPTKWKY